MKAMLLVILTGLLYVYSQDGDVTINSQFCAVTTRKNGLHDWELRYRYVVDDRPGHKRLYCWQWPPKFRYTYITKERYEVIKSELAREPNQ